MLITRERGGNRERRKRGNLCIFLFCSHSPPTAYKRERGGERRGRKRGEGELQLHAEKVEWNSPTNVCFCFSRQVFSHEFLILYSNYFIAVYFKKMAKFMPVHFLPIATPSPQSPCFLSWHNTLLLLLLFFSLKWGGGKRGEKRAISHGREKEGGNRKKRQSLSLSSLGGWLASSHPLLPSRLTRIEIQPSWQCKTHPLPWRKSVKYNINNKFAL